MFWDFIDNYRKARAPEREARDKQYQEQHRQISSQRGFGAVPSQVIGHTLVGAKQGADNISRGLSDFFSAWGDSMNPGHGKIEPMSKDEQLKSFYSNVDSATVDIGNPEAVDFVKKFRVTDESGKKRDVYVGYVYQDESEKNGGFGGKIAAILDEKYSDQPFSGRQALTNYFKKNYTMDSGEYKIDDYGTYSNPSGSPRSDIITDGVSNGVSYTYKVNAPVRGGRTNGKDWYSTSQFNPWSMFPSGHQ